MRLYICGQMTGLPDFNFPEFNRVAKALRECGYEVENPAENEPPCENPQWRDWMRIAIPQMLRCDGVALLLGWSKSRGANLERNLAVGIGMPCHQWEDWFFAPLGGK